MPETYNFPNQKNIIENKFKNYKLNLSDLWLIKPSNKYGGRGITILTSYENIILKEFIITKYITNINLINEKKYDLRLYALITGLEPLRLYFYKEGFVRIASEKFSIDKKSIKNKFIHLTNICINNKNKNYINPNTTKDKNSNIWNILMYKSFLKNFNVEWEDIRKKIKDIIIKSIISVYEKLLEDNIKQKVSDTSFYNLLGYDILITKEFIPKLIEINKNPTMEINNKLEKEIKTNLFVDTLNLVGIVPYSRKTGKSLNKQLNYKRNVEDNINNALCESHRPKGDYELIFPRKENIKDYIKYFKNISEENKKFWNILISQN